MAAARQTGGGNMYRATTVSANMAAGTPTVATANAECRRIMALIVASDNAGGRARQTANVVKKK